MALKIFFFVEVAVLSLISKFEKYFEIGILSVPTKRKE